MPIWNDQTESSYEPKGGTWTPQQPEKPNAGKYQDQGTDKPPAVKNTSDSDRSFHIRDKM